MQTIKEILSYPDRTPITALQARLSGVYEYQTVATKFGDKTIQKVTLEDSTGKIRATFWEHPDLTEHKGKEYVFAGGAKGTGILVKHGSYVPKGKEEKDRVNTIELTVGKAGTLQFIEVHHANAGTKAPPGPASAPVGATSGHDQASFDRPSTGIFGAKAGMLLNNSVLLLCHSGILEGVKDAKAIANAVRHLLPELIAVSDELEGGRLTVQKPKVEEAPAPPVKRREEGDVPY